MKEKWLSLPQKYRDLIVYVFFGGMTTIVNYAVYFPCRIFGNVSVTVSSILAWCVAVLFAFVTNKPFVYHSNDWRWKTTGPELVKFVGCRLGSGAMEIVLMAGLVDYLHFNEPLCKIGVSVLVVVINYVSGKLLAFRHRRKE